jgi:hypothetical protein
MIAAITLAATMTFICAPNDPTRSKLAYVVSFEQDENRMRKIIVLWPNGSQSHDKWKGRVLPTGYQIDAREEYHSSSIELTWSPTNRNAGGLAHRTSVWGGHIIMDDEDIATCTVHSDADPVEIAQ